VTLVPAIVGAFYSLGGQWSTGKVSCRCGRTYDQPTLVEDGPDPWSLVSCKSVPEFVVMTRVPEAGPAYA
jgi:hypothetical protein